MEHASPRSGRSLTLALVLFALGLASLFATSRADAANATCNPVGAGWNCTFGVGSVGPGVVVWFDAAGGYNLRPWNSNEGRDAYGNTVGKCIPWKRSDGVFRSPEVCGTGTPFLEPGAAWRPAWIAVWQYANGARNIWGNAYHGF